MVSGKEIGSVREGMGDISIECGRRSWERDLEARRGGELVKTDKTIE